MIRSALLAAACTLAVGFAAEPYPWTGVWKLDHSRSKFASFKPHREQMFRFETLEDGALRFTEHVVYSDGTKGPAGFGYTGRFDGKEYPLTNERGSTSAVLLSREGADTLAVSIRKDGVTTRTYRMVASPDRRTLTMVSGSDQRVYTREREKSFPDR